MMRWAKGRRAAILASALPTPPAPTRRMRMPWILTRFDTKSSVDIELLLRNPLYDAIIGARTVAREGLSRKGEDMATTEHVVEPVEQPVDKGLKSGALGLVSTTIIATASVAPAYSIAATLV